MSRDAPKRPRRPTPSVAEYNREVAKINIEIKLKLLQFALGLCDRQSASIAFSEKSELYPADVFPAIPSNFRGFNAWESKSLPPGLLSVIGRFEKNGHRTLQSHANLYKSADAAVKLAKMRKRVLQNKPTKLESLAGARRRSNDAVVMRDIAIRESDDLRNELHRSRDKAKKEIIQLTNEIRELKEKNSELSCKIALLEKNSESGKVRQLSGASRRRQTIGPSL